MAKINPKERDHDAGSVLPAAEYGLAIVWFQRRVSQKGSEFFRAKAEVTDGPKKGKACWLILSLDLTKRGAVNRWRILAESVGQEEEFDLGSHEEGTQEEGDATFRRLFVGMPFRAKLKVTTSGQYTNNDIDQFVFPRQWSEGQRAAMEAWRSEYLAKAHDDLGPPDEDGVPPQTDDWGTPPRFDDDIPF